MSSQINSWTQACIACQKSKVHRHTKAPRSEYELPKARFSHVNIDIVGPLPPSQGNAYLLTIVDRFTRWPEAIPLAAMDTEQVARAFIENWILEFQNQFPQTGDPSLPHVCGATSANSMAQT